jgi:hypothetical protein
MYATREPSAEVYQYGFLSRKTARILSELSLGAKLDSENLRILEHARKFMDLVLNGEALISGEGEKEGFAPSEEGLKAFRYGFNALGIMELQLKDRSDLTRELTNIKETLIKVLDGPNGTIPSERLKNVAKFFRLIANSLSDEARRKIVPKVAHLQ